MTFRSLSICVLVTAERSAKTDEPIDMPFGGADSLAWFQETILDGGAY